jgi:hypothetical protein
MADTKPLERAQVDLGWKEPLALARSCLLEFREIAEFAVGEKLLEPEEEFTSQGETGNR